MARARKARAGQGKPGLIHGGIALDDTALQAGVRERIASALSRSELTDNLDALYGAWLELRLARADAAAERARAEEKLRQRSSYLLGAVRAAQEVGLEPRSGAKSLPAKRAPESLLQIEAQAQRELEEAQRELKARLEREEALFAASEGELRERLKKRVEQHLRAYAPHLTLRLSLVGPSRCLLQADRPSADDAVLLLALLTCKLCSRHGFFADDAVGELAAGPSFFYAEEGLGQDRLPTVEAEDELAFEPSREVLPIRGMIPFRLPDRDFPRFRLVQHGPVAEVEAREGPGRPYDHLLDRSVAELLTGYLLRLKVEGRLELDLSIS